jgi:hypothetical protein
MKEACAHVEGMKADMRGTEIAKPLNYALQTKIIKGFPRQILLLTGNILIHTHIYIFVHIYFYCKISCIKKG